MKYIRIETTAGDFIEVKAITNECVDMIAAAIRPILMFSECETNITNVTVLDH